MLTHPSELRFAQLRRLAVVFFNQEHTMPHTVIVGRSPAAIRDDELCDAHSHLTSLLNEMSSGYCLYRGEQRKALVALRAQVEAEILGAGRAPELLRFHIHALIRTDRRWGA